LELQPGAVEITYRRVADMTETHAQAVEAATRNQFAIPARHETIRHALTIAVVAGVAAWLLRLLGEAMNNPTSNAVTPLALTLAAIVAVLGAGPAVTSIMKQINKPPTSG
jgi:hypothetical protein